MPALLHSSDTSNCFTNVAGETPSTSDPVRSICPKANIQNGKRPAGGGVVPDEPGPRGLLAGRFRDPIKLLPLHVDDGQLVVLFDRFRGILNETIGEGTHFLIPWVQKPYIFDIRTHTHTFSFVSGTKDLQMNLGLEYNEKVLPSIGNEVLKAVVAQFNTDQLLTDRPHLSALMCDG
ncbi:hypothetical protein JHK87_043135 [Glycine soja]|nr:hypothetical protein JHK87_043135 [Glycine soja]